MENRVGIVLAGGGARGSYQAGALRALYEIIKKDQLMFDIITGNSVGAINAVALASYARDWGSGTQYLVDLWNRLRVEDIFDIDTIAISGVGLKWVSNTLLGAESVSRPFNHLLNTNPLQSLLNREIDFKEIHQLIEDKLLTAISLSTTNYYSGTNVIFFDGDKKIESWEKSDRFSVKTILNIEHVMSASAIPVFFPPVKIKESYYGDGCIRQTTPLSPSIHLGATKIIAIGIRNQVTNEKMHEMVNMTNANPTMGQVAGVIMNAIFLDSLDSDIERFNKMNIVAQTSGKKYKWNYIPLLALKPSRDLGIMTEKMSKELPKILRYLFRGIGVTGKSGLDLLSYLAFDSNYTQQLVELGYLDTMNRKEEILRFIEL